MEPTTYPRSALMGTPLNTVEQFIYFGSVISNDATVAKDVDNRIAKASSSFGCLKERVRQNHSLRLSTKLHVYRAIIVTTLLYGYESWVLYRRQVQLLELFHQRCLRSITGIHWQDYITNNEVLEQASLPSIEAMLMMETASSRHHHHQHHRHHHPPVRADVGGT